MTFWTGRRVAVTGGRGFLGKRLVDRLERAGAGTVFPLGRADYDLRDRGRCAALVEELRPDVIVHAAAVVGGIGANLGRPGTFFYENAVMGIHLIEEARRAWSAAPGGLARRKFVCLGTVCAYPKHTPVPFREEDLWSGYPEETNAAYGLAKKMLLVQLQAYATQFEFPGVYVLPVNLYGPGDHDDLETSHVIPGMVRKFVEAGRDGLPEVVLWGDGTPTREFLHVDDAAAGILAAAEKLGTPEPVNLGSGEEIAMKDLAEILRRLTDYRGVVSWDVSRPNGQPRRRLDVGRAERLLGWRARIPFEEGLRETVEDFRRRFGARA